MVSLKNLFGPKRERKFGFDEFAALGNDGTRRVCFGSTHKKALKENSSGKAAGFLNLPFKETFNNLNDWELWPNKKGKYGGFYRIVSDDAEFSEIQAWIEENRDVVFLKSLVSSCVSLAEGFEGHTRTTIGQLEYEAKYKGDSDAEAKLVDHFKIIFDRLYSAKGIDGILGMPSSRPGENSFPMKMAKALSEKCGIECLNGWIEWTTEKPSLKEQAMEEKWATLEQIGLELAGDFENRKVLLLDDLYQSGATMHFVASKISEANPSEIHCISAVKARRDSDNK